MHACVLASQVKLCAFIRVLISFSPHSYSSEGCSPGHRSARSLRAPTSISAIPSVLDFSPPTFRYLGCVVRHVSLPRPPRHPCQRPPRAWGNIYYYKRPRHHLRNVHARRSVESLQSSRHIRVAESSWSLLKFPMFMHACGRVVAVCRRSRVAKSWIE